MTANKKKTKNRTMLINLAEFIYFNFVIPLIKSFFKSVTLHKNQCLNFIDVSLYLHQ